MNKPRWVRFKYIFLEITEPSKSWPSLSNNLDQSLIMLLLDVILLCRKCVADEPKALFL